MIYGQILSERVHGVPVLQLWPHDFPISAKTEDSRPLASLWRAQVAGVGQIDVSFTGLERQAWNGAARWFAQRWTCEPTTFADIVKALSEPDRRYGEIKPRSN